MSSRTAYSPWPLWFLAGGLAGVGLAWLSVPHVGSSSRSHRNLECDLRARVRALLRSRDEWTVLSGPGRALLR
jgi:hypothetical protein